jgi:hypothetical protein
MQRGVKAVKGCVIQTLENERFDFEELTGSWRSDIT